MNISLERLPYDEATEILRGKPVVTRRVFDAMVPEIRARAFTIAGLEDADAMQRIRDRIADLPQGAKWDEVKADIAAELPYQVDDDASPEEREQQVAAAYRKAELLMRMQGFQAYAAAGHNVMVQIKAAFPWWQYVTAGDGNVRDSHAALNNVVLPADSPFWEKHSPPWDWGCRCEKIALDPEAVDEIRAEDEGRNPEDRLVLGDEQLRRLESDGELMRGPIAVLDPEDPERKKVLSRIPGGRFDVRAPAERAETEIERRSAWQWEPGSMRLPIEQVRDRYDEDTWSAFERAMREAELVDVDGAVRTVWAWLTGAAV